MATSTDTHISRVILDTKEAKEKLNELQAKLKDVQRAKEEAYAKGESTTALERQINRINAEINNYETSQQQVNRVLKNMSSASYKELSLVAKALNKELKSGAIERNSEEWKHLNEQLRKVRGEMASINNEARLSVGTFGKIFNFLNKNWGAITQTIAGFGTLRDMVQKCSQAYADMEESMADVRKYTGQTDEQVHQMNEDFKKMDTRTAREQLNELAGSAGRLGITSKSMIEEFVDGADKINVALGDDLGKGAVDKIGKLAQMFGEDKTKGLRGAMLATGSAVNELAQNSSANAGYIVDFTADLSGVGIQAGMTQAQLMGLASALDQNMQEEATSATVFSQLITKMYQEPAKFAKIAGIEVQKFTNMMKTNANEGLMQFLTAMKSKGGFAEMAPMFEDMQLNGTRAVGVLSAVASHLDQVKTAQELATQSYAAGTSVLDEFNVQNNTVQADLDKAKKRFQDLAVELGEKLIPVTRYAISSMNVGLGVLSTLLTFLATHIKTIAMLGSAIAVCTALWYKETIAIKLKSAATAYATAMDKAAIAVQALLKSALVALQATWALLTKGVEGYVAVMKAARLASLTNPWAALATVLTVVGVAVYGAVKAFVSYNEAIRNSTQEARNAKAVAEEQASLAKKVSDATLDERNKVDMLNKVIHSNAYTVNERKQAIAAMQKLVPEYHASISKEGKLYNDNQIAIQNYIKELENAAMAEAIYERKVEINKQKLDLKQKENRIRGSLKAVAAERQAHPERYKTEKTTIQSSDGVDVNLYRDTDALKSSKQQEEIHNKRLKETLSLQEQLNAKEKYYNQELEKNVSLQKQYNNVKKTKLYAPAQPDDSGTTGNGYVSDKSNKKAAAEQKKREIAARKAAAEEKKRLKKELDDAKKSTEAEQLEAATLYSTGQIRLAEYNERMASIKEEGLQKRMDILKKYGQAESEEYNRLGAEKEKIAADYEKKQTDDLEAIENNRISAEMNIRANYYNKDSDIYHDEEALKEALFLLEQNYLDQKQELYLSSSDEWWQIEKERERTQTQRQYERQEEFDKRLLQLKQEYLNMGNEEQMKLELKGLDELHKAGLVKEEEYQRMKLGIANKYASYQPDSKGQAKEDASKALDTARKMTRQGDDGSGSLGSDNLVTIAGGAIAAISQQKMVNDNLDKLREKDLISEQAYQDAKKQLSQDTFDKITSFASAAFSSMSSMMGAASAYSQACSDLEVAKIQKNYDKQISAAGNNSAKKKKLEAKRDKEIAKAKSKANKKAMKIEVAQAIASTALSAINAYASAAKIPTVGYIIAPIAAGMATAAGMLQIATIKKQHQAEEAGYYEGGFTGSGNYRKEAGVVHAGEFVANHHAVNNPQLLPALQLIDAAQRNNTVASLTAQDVSRAMGTGSAAVVAPVVNVNADNEQVVESLDSVSHTISQLNEKLNDGIESYVVITGPRGLAKQWREYNKMLGNK